MANSVEKVEAERPGDAHLGSEDDGSAEVHVLQNQAKEKSGREVSQRGAQQPSGLRRCL